MSQPSIFPLEFLERLSQIIPPAHLLSVLQSYQSDRPTTLRVNTLKSDPETVRKDLSVAGLSIEPVSEIPLAFTLRQGSFKQLTESHSYREGWIYLQSLSSQIPPLVLAPKPGETVLDLAAAPGGKTCQMAALMQNKGRIVAVEPDAVRADRLQFNIKAQGVRIAEVLRQRGEKMPAEFHGRFDKVLLDAPCSSEGTFCAQDPQSFAHWSVEFTKKISRVQRLLLEKAWLCVKPGGTIVYSTCALSPEENEEVVNWALLNGPSLKVESLPFKTSFLRPSLKAWKNTNFDAQVARARRIYPSETMEGFFVAVLKRCV